MTKQPTDFQSTRALGEQLASIYGSGRGTGPEGALTWDEYQAELSQWRERGGPKIDWLSVAAYLAAQLAGERKLTHADAHHAILQVAAIVHRFEDARRVPPPA